MVNVNKLKGKLVEKGLSVEALAKEIGINRATLYRKLNTADEFSIKEADTISKILELTHEEVVLIFFNICVA